MFKSKREALMKPGEESKGASDKLLLARVKLQTVSGGHASQCNTQYFLTVFWTKHYNHIHLFTHIATSSILPKEEELWDQTTDSG